MARAFWWLFATSVLSVAQTRGSHSGGGTLFLEGADHLAFHIPEITLYPSRLILELIHLKALGMLNLVPVPPQIVDCKIGVVDRNACEKVLVVDIGGNKLTYQDFESIFAMLPNYRSSSDGPQHLSPHDFYSTFEPTTTQDLGLFTLYNYYLMQDIFFGPIWKAFSSGADAAKQPTPKNQTIASHGDSISGSEALDSSPPASYPSADNSTASGSAAQAFPSLTTVLSAVRDARLVEPLSEAHFAPEHLRLVSAAQRLLDCYLHGTPIVVPK
ncbi:hypothetical protein BESB_011900 [Besnoitia besnoiti]|uniref:Uncharacterized protein n=1 Tax=Besnoitia besnoiti TaxID=94643 RepID=A0A2A9M253_BESBE|nr:hypothetical protein BESB_011900 [Besnoitia besnoiti]PFH32578.1 hypothetical protein BESB_011900 [Besnoitia besnoiti]